MVTTFAERRFPYRREYSVMPFYLMTKPHQKVYRYTKQKAIYSNLFRNRLCGNATGRETCYRETTFRKRLSGKVCKAYTSHRPRWWTVIGTFCHGDKKLQQFQGRCCRPGTWCWWAGKIGHKLRHCCLLFSFYSKVSRHASRLHNIRKHIRHKHVN